MFFVFTFNNIIDNGLFFYVFFTRNHLIPFTGFCIHSLYIFKGWCQLRSSWMLYTGLDTLSLCESVTSRALIIIIRPIIKVPNLYNLVMSICGVIRFNDEHVVSNNIF